MHDATVHRRIVVIVVAVRVDGQTNIVLFD
jgi:hypothetical protein